MSERMHRFGPELRRLRLAAGLTLDRLAALVHYSKSYLSKVETGQKRPTPDLARLCDTALDAGGALAVLVPEQAAPVGLPTISHRGEVWLLRMSKEGWSQFESMDRRQVTAAGAGAVLGLGLGGPRSSAEAQGTSLIEASRSLFVQFRLLGQTSGPGVLLPSLIAQTHSLEQLALRSGSRTRRELLVLASRFAEYAGWMAQESGNDEAALWWTDRAVELAAAGEDRHLAAYGLVRRSLVSLLRGDVAQALGLAEHALNGNAPPRIRGLAAQQQAQGHALSGNYRACMRSLDQARELLALDPPDPGAPVIGASHVPDVAAMYTGWCLYHLGQPQRAAEVYAQETARIPGHAWRTRTRCGIRLALAHAAAGEIERACELLRPLLDQAGMVQSATIATDLRRTVRILGRHSRNAAVEALSPYLAAALTNVSPSTPQ
ncbi:helix-turn-helix domain-containing protein [Streptomyces litchfieldiae]|uniref:Helix-turn-helix transcriptional regulator n=1 Tax=Streptomyces litchfieldiae TaxID=3075543 RepID=A0ABU2MS09_9ACTN|nr:helix-turn-helix transcriptional regulator [Streptomyces sp. DSM 44938]MDT0344419.1 helix-turn-helix transcriptional regulator [Streptomyces sp. DSM 44938]